MVTLYIFQTVFVCFHFADTFWSRITHQQCKLRRIADEKEHNKNIKKKRWCRIFYGQTIIKSKHKCQRGMHASNNKTTVVTTKTRNQNKNDKHCCQKYHIFIHAGWCVLMSALPARSC